MAGDLLQGLRCGRRAMTDTQREFHPLANMFPSLLGAEIATLAADIKKHGLREPIVRYEGMILDGRNRYRACLRAGVAPRYQEITFADRAAAIAYVISANIHRRHLTSGQKRAVIAKLLQIDPTQSDRAVAEAAKVDHKTVAKVRSEAEASGEIPHTDKRTDRTGKQRPVRQSPDKPASKPKPAKPAPSATEQPSAPPPPKPQAAGPYSAGECDRLRVRVDELGDEKRLLEIKIAGLESENRELKKRIGELENARR
jgi:ParB-like chromosome segregation protein Spo0J